MPVAPASVAALLGNHEAYLAFRRIVQEVFPDAASEILAAEEHGGSRENARVWAFLHRVEAEHFPIYEVDEYEQVIGGIPFVRNAWSYDRLHELDMPAGELLLFTLCAQPFLEEYGSRVPLLDAAEAHVPKDLLLQIPEHGLSPEELHERLDGTPYAAAAEFADWLWAATDTAFLDLDEEVDVSDADWTRENVLELAEQWRRANGILDRITELARWLEADRPAHFAALLDAALGRDPKLEYQRARRLYAYEITEAGLVAIEREPDRLALPPSAAA